MLLTSKTTTLSAETGKQTKPIVILVFLVMCLKIFKGRIKPVSFYCKLMIGFLCRNSSIYVDQSQKCLPNIMWCSVKKWKCFICYQCSFKLLINVFVIKYLSYIVEKKTNVGINFTTKILRNHQSKRNNTVLNSEKYRTATVANTHKGNGSPAVNFSPLL